jgi:hypothetical protein
MTTQTTQTNHYLRGLALLAVGLLTLFAFSIPAAGKQSDDHQQSVSGSNKKDAAVAIESSTTVPKASFASGSGVNFLGVKVSDHGNLLSFESPQGQEAVFDGREGYAVCTSRAATVHGHDTGSAEAGFGAPTFSQPNGRGKFPLTVTRRTTDGNKPDATEKDVTVTMTLKNLSNAPIFGVFLSRSGDFDIGFSGDQGASTDDSAWQWVDGSRTTTDLTSGGVMLTALTFGTNHGAFIESSSDWVGGTREGCLRGGQLPTPTSVQDLAMRVIYNLGDFNAGQSKTVKFEYRRM